jgi:hypothetical protein
MLIDINFRAYLADPTPAKLRKAKRRCDIPPAAVRATTMPNARFMLSPDAGHELFLDQPKAFLDGR